MAEALYTLIPEEKLKSCLFSLHSCLELPVQLLGQGGAPLLNYGETSSYCRLLKKNVFQNNECQNMHLKAGQVAYALGKSYIFSCHADLNHIAFPFVSHHVLLGAIIIGPFLMDSPDSTLITELSESYELNAKLCLELYDELQFIPIVTPKRVEQISVLTNFIFEPLLSNERLIMQEKQGRLYQQSRIGETIQMYKGDKRQQSSEYIYQKEQQLLSRVKMRNISEAKAVLNDLLGFVIFSEGSRSGAIKTRALELTTLLSRVAIEAGGITDRILSANQIFMNEILEAGDDEELCYILQKIVENFILMISIPSDNKGNAAIKKALQYIAKHFDEPLSIQSMAEVLNLSPSYFSSLFSKHMKIGFHEYLTRVRIEEAKNLLTATDYPIDQIAVSVGYADQSSFTKAYKRITGITPYQAR